MKKLLIGLVVLLLLVTASYAAMTWRGTQDTVTQPQPIGSSPTESEPLVAEGKVVPLQHAVLSLPTGGIVTMVRAAEGDQVTAGQLLLGLDRARAEANVAQAEAA